MSRYRIIRQVTPAGHTGFACTVMAIREDTADRNEYLVRICATEDEARRTSHEIEALIRAQVEARGGTVVPSAAPVNEPL
jgi:hypothetical protein